MKAKNAIEKLMSLVIKYSNEAKNSNDIEKLSDVESEEIEGGINFGCAWISGCSGTNYSCQTPPNSGCY
jgi:hypothetical protein